MKYDMNTGYYASAAKTTLSRSMYSAAGNFYFKNNPPVELFINSFAVSGTQTTVTFGLLSNFPFGSAYGYVASGGYFYNSSNYSGGSNPSPTTKILVVTLLITLILLIILNMVIGELELKLIKTTTELTTLQLIG